MNLQRLMHTRFSGLADRGRQELWKSMERRALLGATEPHARVPAFGEPRAVAMPHTAAPAAESRVTLDRFRARAAANFFSGFSWSALPQVFSERLSGDRRQIIALADNVVAGRFDLLGHEGVRLGSAIDWHRDPLSGRSAPLVHWSQVDALDAGTLGDSKVIWELNRHQWFLYLGQAWRFTRDERYARAWAENLRAWLAANQPEMGINWASSLELAYRLIVWCWSLHLFSDSRTLDAELFSEITASIARQAAHVARYPSYHYSPNTHLTGEALGLVYVGLLFPEWHAARRWRQIGERILRRELYRQVYADGVYFEQSTCYQQYTAETYLHWLILAERSGAAIPARHAECVQRMLDVLLVLRRPDGSMPQIGDTDGGRLLPLVRRPRADFRGLFALGAALFRRPDYAWAAGGLAPEVVWLLGAEGRAAFEQTAPAHPHRTSHLLPQGGYAVMRNHWGASGHQLIFDAGPLGCPLSGAHGHADLLAVQCAAFGDTHLLDPGTYCYTADAAWRNYFRGTAAHNTVTVDDLDQAVPSGPFSWQHRPRARLNRWVSNPEFDLADAEHEAYFNLAGRIVHRRRVLFVKPRYWVLVDDVQGRTVHRLQLHFQFARTDVSLEADGWVRSRARHGGLLLRSFSSAKLTTELRQGSLEPRAGWVSPDYGQLLAAPMVNYVCRARLPLRIVTLLLPVADADEPPPAVTAEITGNLFRLVFEHNGESVNISGHDLRVEFAAAAMPRTGP